MSVLQPYFEPILGALIVFPFVAFFMTLPYMIRTYRRYNGISRLRIVIVYSFVLYMLCAFLLTVLPLPHMETVMNRPRIHIQWKPFANFIAGTGDCGLDFTRPSTLLNTSAWIAYLTSGDFFQIVANIVMLIPLGMYLRYYFRFSFRKTILAGFLTSLFFELVQLSGLFFIYPQPYRCPDINDLMANTLGAVIGFWIAKPLTSFLPSRDEIDRITWKKTDHVSLLRQIAAVSADWILLGIVNTLITCIWDLIQEHRLVLAIHPQRDLIVTALYFCLLQYWMKGRTPGKILLRIHAINRPDTLPSKACSLASVPQEDAMPQMISPEQNMVQRLSGEDHPVSFPHIWQYAVRYAIIYIVYPLLFLTNTFSWAICAVLFFYDNIAVLRIIGLAGTLVCNGLSIWFLLHSLLRKNRMPHDALSHIDVVLEE